VPEDTYESDEISQHSSNTECLLAQQHTLLWNKDKYLEISPGQNKSYHFRAYTWGKPEPLRQTLS
jgi:hypothetical protein